MTTSNSRRGPALFNFRELDDSVGVRLESALAELPETHTSGMEGYDVFDSVVLDRRNCVLKILAAISKDYEVNKREEPQAPWSFDYVVELDEGNMLSVMARLSAKASDSSGNVFYGASVVRVGPDSYAIWSDFD